MAYCVFTTDGRWVGGGGGVGEQDIILTHVEMKDLANRRLTGRQQTFNRLAVAECNELNVEIRAEIGTSHGVCFGDAEDSGFSTDSAPLSPLASNPRCFLHAGHCKSGEKEGGGGGGKKEKKRRDGTSERLTGKSTWNPIPSIIEAKKKIQRHKATGRSTNQAESASFLYTF